MTFLLECVSLERCRVLDIGCGGGILTESLCTSTNQVIGIDPAKELLATALAHARSLPYPPTYEATTAEAYVKEHPLSFDIITCMELLEHVPQPEALLGTLASLLKPGGHLFLSTLNRTPRTFLEAIIGAEYLLNWIPKGTHEYAHCIRPRELASWARKHDLVVKKMQGISYSLRKRAFTFSPSLSVNYLMYLQKS